MILSFLLQVQMLRTLVNLPSMFGVDSVIRLPVGRIGCFDSLQPSSLVSSILFFLLVCPQHETLPFHIKPNELQFADDAYDLPGRERRQHRKVLGFWLRTERVRTWGEGDICDLPGVDE
jgi:hypothetical protein